MQNQIWILLTGPMDPSRSGRSTGEEILAPIGFNQKDRPSEYFQEKLPSLCPCLENLKW